MGLNIGPIVPRDPVPGAKSVKKKNDTAAKVGKIRLPVVCRRTSLQGRPVAHLQEARDLSKYINKRWNEMAPEELAKQIIKLEDKISLIKETSPSVEKVRSQAQNLHFKFVFPVAKEMDIAPSESAMPVSFARMIYRAAHEVFTTNSVRAFSNLNGVQKREVMRYAAGRNL